MCGIACVIFRGSISSQFNNVIEPILNGVENRGQDGIGISIIKRITDSRKVVSYYSSTNPTDRTELFKFLDDNLRQNDILLVCSRAIPETKEYTNEQQPICVHNTVVVHCGSISDRSVSYLKERYKFETGIDSEAISVSYSATDRNMKETLSSLEGGMAVILYDCLKDYLYVATNFEPLSDCYIDGIGYIVSTDRDSIDTLIDRYGSDSLSGFSSSKEIEYGTIREINLELYSVLETKWASKYITANWSSDIISNNKHLCLVAMSGGFDSAMTLLTLHMAGFEVMAVHVSYGQIGQSAELAATNRICSEYDIPCKYIDFQIYKELCLDISCPLLSTDDNMKAGESDTIDTLYTWVPGRNGLILQTMAIIGETLILNNEYDYVSFCGGFQSLTETGTFPDNSIPFMNSFLKYMNFSSLIGDRIVPMEGMSNILKSEQLILMDGLNLHNLYSMTLSCDRPILKDDGISYNCSKNGKPACLSGAVMYWAADTVGIDDMSMRNFYEITDDSYELADKQLQGKVRHVSVEDVVSRIGIPAKNKDILLNLLII